MKSNFYIVKWNSGQPSTFYDENTQLIWVMKYTLFKNIYLGRIKTNRGIKYAIHKDVYDAFYFKYRNSLLRKTRKNREK